MRTKTRTTLDLKPGMVIRYDFSTSEFRQVATIKRGPWPNTRYITFTDGTGNWYHATNYWTVLRGKAGRHAVQARAAQPQTQPHPIHQALSFFGAYGYQLLTTTA